MKRKNTGKKAKTDAATDKFVLIAGNSSLDFVNTEIFENDLVKDTLENFTDFAEWMVATNLVERSIADEIIIPWIGRPESEDILAQAKGFRKVLRETVTQLTRGQMVNDVAIAAINAELQKLTNSVKVFKTKTGFRKTVLINFTEPRQMLSLIAQSVTELLCDGSLEHIKKCESNDCELYFYDTTKNHTRRRCSMEICGNRAKASAFYQRQKLKSAANIKTVIT